MTDDDQLNDMGDVALGVGPPDFCIAGALSGMKTLHAPADKSSLVSSVVDRAKGLLMTRQSMTEPDAFRWIQRTAMDRRTTMKAVAEAVVDGLAAPRS